MYLNERQVYGNTSLRLRELRRAQPEGTIETEHWYFPVLPSSRHIHIEYKYFKHMTQYHTNTLKTYTLKAQLSFCSGVEAATRSFAIMNSLKSR